MSLFFSLKSPLPQKKMNKAEVVLSFRSYYSLLFFQELLLFFILSGVLVLYYSFRSSGSLLFFQELLIALSFILSGVLAAYYSFRSSCSLLFFQEFLLFFYSFRSSCSFSSQCLTQHFARSTRLGLISLSVYLFVALNIFVKIM